MSVKANKKPYETISSTIELAFDQAVANYNRGNYSQAVVDYKLVIALDAMHPDAHVNLASAYRQLERFSEANAEYKVAAEAIKDDTDLYSEWGYCLGKADEWDKAIARLTTAKKVTSDAINLANVGWAYLNAAQKGSYDLNQTAVRLDLVSGKEMLNQAIAMNPQLAVAFLNLGIIYNLLGEYKIAAEILKKASELREGWLTAINELGMAYLKSSDYAAAIIQFQKVINLDDKFVTGYRNLSDAQYLLGRKKRCEKDTRKTAADQS